MAGEYTKPAFPEGAEVTEQVFRAVERSIRNEAEIHGVKTTVVECNERLDRVEKLVGEVHHEMMSRKAIFAFIGASLKWVGWIASALAALFGVSHLGGFFKWLADIPGK